VGLKKFRGKHKESELNVSVIANEVRDREPTGFICGPKLYKFEGWFFQYHPWTSGPWPLKKDGDPRERAGKVFYDVFNRFDALSDLEKKKHRVGGGCVQL